MKMSLFITCLLVLIAIVLGYAIYQQSLSSPATIDESPVSSKKNIKPLPPDLSEDEKALLTPPSPDAPQSEKEEHDALAAKLSKESDVLDITNCRSNPLVLRAKINQNLKVENKDNIDRKLIFDDAHQYLILKNGAATVKVDFGKGAGLYGYVCEGVGLTGFILVTP